MLRLPFTYVCILAHLENGGFVGYTRHLASPWPKASVCCQLVSISCSAPGQLWPACTENQAVALLPGLLGLCWAAPSKNPDSVKHAPLPIASSTHAPEQWKECVFLISILDFTEALALAQHRKSFDASRCCDEMPKTASV